MHFLYGFTWPDFLQEVPEVMAETRPKSVKGLGTTLTHWVISQIQDPLKLEGISSMIYLNPGKQCRIFEIF